MQADYRYLYTHFLAANPDRLHFAAHSHHLWPDVTRQAHLKYWDDSARLADSKWEYIFTKVIPETQRHIAALLGLSRPQQICFAPNTHEFVVRLLSCFAPGAPLRVLTTDGEFHSFKRQLDRLREYTSVEVCEVAVEPFDTFTDRFSLAAQSAHFDLIYLSQVFFSLGYAIKDIGGLVSRFNSARALIVIDGYHGFCALPTDLSAIENQVFYIAGGYKYAQAGEGACFMHVPIGNAMRPWDTGWFASFGTLERAQSTAERVQYASDGFRFWGATFDPTGIYRMAEVLRMLEREGITISGIHAHVQRLQRRFLDAIGSAPSTIVPKEALLAHDLSHHAHFLTFRFAAAAEVNRALAGKGIVTDVRGDCLRFGFGLYHTNEDVDRLARELARSS